MMNRLIQQAGLWTILALASCQAEAPKRNSHALKFYGEDDRGDPVSGIHIALGQAELGLTGASGELRTQIRASHGQKYPVRARCPKEYEPAQVPADLVFRETREIAGQPSSVSVRILCSRSLRVAALLVHATGVEGLPISIDGVVEGHTGLGGFEHLRIDAAPGTKVDVALDTSSMPELRPSNPSRILSIGATDSLLIFDQEFHKDKPVRKRRRRAKKRPEAQAKRRPVRID